LANIGLNDLDAEEVGKVVNALQDEIQIIKTQLENLPGYEKGNVHLIRTNRYYRRGSSAPVEFKVRAREDLQ